VQTKNLNKMKHAVASTALAFIITQSVSSFVAPVTNQWYNPTGLQLSEMAEEPPRTVVPKMSESLPWLVRPAALTGKLAGDAGFDPFGFARDEGDLMNYREAELKHARLAMLAAAGWPLSEVFDTKIAAFLGWAPVLDASDRAPSFLNGGLGKISPLYWVAVIALAGAIDLVGIQRIQEQQSKKSASTYLAGDFGFDPLGLYPKNNEAGRKRMQLAEIKNGRLAMIAVLAFAIQEAVTKIGIVDETPLFFFPLGETLKNYQNSGYLN
jgi:hypothetical protein